MDRSMVKTTARENALIVEPDNVNPHKTVPVPVPAVWKIRGLPVAALGEYEFWMRSVRPRPSGSKVCQGDFQHGTWNIGCGTGYDEGRVRDFQPSLRHCCYQPGNDLPLEISHSAPAKKEGGHHTERWRIMSRRFPDSSLSQEAPSSRSILGNSWWVSSFSQNEIKLAT